MKNNKLAIILKGIIKENPVLVLILGTCPTLAVSTSVIAAFGMGLAATAVLICSNVAISAEFDDDDDYADGDEDGKKPLPRDVQGLFDDFPVEVEVFKCFQ